MAHARLAISLVDKIRFPFDARRAAVAALMIVSGFSLSALLMALSFLSWKNAGC
jgi:hypothetical protein